MNILFLNIGPANPLIGGVQCVTNKLADYFSSLNHLTYILSICRTSDYTDNMQYYMPNPKSVFCDENKKFLMNFINDRHIDIVMNQTCLEPQFCDFLPSIKKTGIPIVSVFHNSPYGMYGINAFPKIYDAVNSKITRALINQSFHFLFKLKYGRYLRQILQYSDKMVMLSDKFINEIMYFTGNKNAEKIIAIPNPLTSSSKLKGEKENIVLFVGRLSREKGVDKLLEAWSGICHDEKYKDWKLVIVGDGDIKGQLEQYAIDMKLVNYSFEGFQKPDEYYSKAKIFCMASRFEGFGLVLVEAMSYSVVPLAFNSFPNCSDIIDDNENGILVTPFVVSEYRTKLAALMNDNDRLKTMSASAVNKSRNFSIEKIGAKWLDLFSMLINNSKYNNIYRYE